MTERIKRKQFIIFPDSIASGNNLFPLTYAVGISVILILKGFLHSPVNGSEFAFRDIIQFGHDPLKIVLYLSRHAYFLHIFPQKVLN